MHSEQLTATVMFTDLEGSTALVSRMGDEAAGTVFAQHDLLIRQQIADHGGREVRGMGDGFLALFTSSRSALRCAIAIERAMDERNAARSDAELRVRIGLNAGDVAIEDGDVRGAAIHAAARVMALARGGEILVTDAVRDAAASGADVVFRDRGWMALRGFPERRRLHEVVWRPGAPSTPVLTGDHAADAVGGRLIGREGDLGALTTMLRERVRRLVTVVGPGGVGKTTLAGEVVRELAGAFAHGVAVVPLAPVREDADVPAAVALALGIERLPGEDVKESLARELGPRETLLFLDNFEHVVGSASLVARLLAKSQDLTVLVTNREPLRLRDEQVYRLAPLSEAPAVRLFVAAAQRHEQAFALTSESAPAVAEICDRVDGLPLALELAAEGSRWFRPRSWPTACAGITRCWAQALATRRRASRRCAAPWSGATRCSMPPSNARSPRCRSSPAERRSQQRCRWPTRASTSSNHS